MTQPTVLNKLTDSRTGIQYVVMAYRELSEPELIQAVRNGISLMKPKPKKGHSYTFITTIGSRDPL